MQQQLTNILIIGLWGALVAAILPLDVPLPENLKTHAICGPWGCGPPLDDLLRWHGFCLALMALPIGYLVIFCPPATTRYLTILITTAAVAGLLGILAWEAATWLPKVRAGQPSYFWQRYLFRVATLVDVPILPTLVVGLVLSIRQFVVGKRSKATQNSHDPPSEALTSAAAGGDRL